MLGKPRELPRTQLYSLREAIRVTGLEPGELRGKYSSLGVMKRRGKLFFERAKVDGLADSLRSASELWQLHAEARNAHFERDEAAELMGISPQAVARLVNKRFLTGIVLPHPKVPEGILFVRKAEVISMARRKLVAGRFSESKAKKILAVENELGTILAPVPVKLDSALSAHLNHANFSRLEKEVKPYSHDQLRSAEIAYRQRLGEVKNLLETRGPPMRVRFNPTTGRLQKVEHEDHLRQVRVENSLLLAKLSALSDVFERTHASKAAKKQK